MIIDFRLRPPYKDFTKLGMFTNLERCARYAANVGAELAPSIKNLSMELVIREMDENGIDIGVASGRTHHWAGGMSNDVLIELVDSYPKRFAGLAGLNPHDWRWSLEEIRRTVIDGPLRGVCLEPGAVRPAMYGDDPNLYPIYEECEKRDIPCMVMLGGNAGPDISYSFPRMIHKIAADLPGVNFIVSHGGWPWVQPVLGVCFFQPNIYISPDLYIFNLPGWQDYVSAANTYLQDRFLYASAYPFMPISVVNEFKKLFRPEVLPKLLFDNAAKLLKLKD